MRVRMGMEKIDDAKQAKKQVEKQRQELEKKLQEGQKNLEGAIVSESQGDSGILGRPGRPVAGACRMRPSILARGWGSMEGTAVCAFVPIGARVGGGDRPARQIAGRSL